MKLVNDNTVSKMQHNCCIKSISHLQLCRYFGEKSTVAHVILLLMTISYDINIGQKPIEGLFFAIRVYESCIMFVRNSMQCKMMYRSGRSRVH